MTEPSDKQPSLPLAANTQLDDHAPALEGLIDRMKRDHAMQSRAETIAPQDLREIPSVGRYMLPRQNSYAAHKQLIEDASLGLAFSPALQPAFDALLETSRTELAILRNTLMCQFFAQQAHAVKVQHLSAIARYLQSQPALLHIAGGKGLQTLYVELLRRQQTPLWRMPSVWLRPQDRPQNWGLGPLERSPFSDAALQMPPPAPETTVSAIASFEAVPMANRDSKDPREAQPEKTLSVAGELNAIANEMASAGALTMSVEELHEPTRREAIELAKDILDKLRVKLGEALLINGLSQFDMNPLIILGELKHVVKAFEFHLHKVAGLDANIYENPAVTAANSAVGKLSVLAKQATLNAALKQGDTRMAALVTADLAQLPKAWQPSPNDHFAGLFNDLESGLKAVIDRINQLADKDASAEFWLGFSAEKSLGSADHGHKDNKPQKAMGDDDFYRQLNAQRAMRARQAAVRYTQSQQRSHHHDDSPPPSARPVNLNQLVGGDMLASMRNAMKTSASAAAVETGAKANIQNVIRQKDQIVKAQRQRIVTEQMRRANQRQDGSHDDHGHHDHHHDLSDHEPIQPPPGKKKDHSHGI